MIETEIWWSFRTLGQRMKKCEKKIELKFNKLCIFSTDNYSFHGYPDPIKCPENISRKSLALYYYSNGRPNQDQMKEMPNTTNWKNRFNIKNEVDNNYSFKDYLRKFTFIRKIKKIHFKIIRMISVLLVIYKSDKKMLNNFLKKLTVNLI